MVTDFDHTIEIWIAALNAYSFTQLCTRPAANSWSLGQLYMHLINDTNFFLEQIKVCLSNNDNASEQPSPEARKMFLNDGFPDLILEGPPSNLHTPQPVNKEQLITDLVCLQQEMNTVKPLLVNNAFKGKTLHPGLEYFNAEEWFHFAEMHFRHHLKQKKRIEEYLKINEIT